MKYILSNGIELDNREVSHVEAYEHGMFKLYLNYGYVIDKVRIKREKGDYDNGKTKH